MPVRAWKARKTLTERFRRSGAPIPLARGFQVARNRASPLQSHCTVQAATRLVGGRRPSVLQRWGVWGSPPDGFRLRSRRCRNRGGSIVLEIGEQKHARDFEAAKEQCRIDNPMSNVNI
uniref:Uncharacterized protein n=1 Tax=Escherichia coli TaxID=562 RepID=A0A3G4RXA6_ECOLX|nr:hypothetical protein D0362_00165 [Escherichia coli]